MSHRRHASMRPLSVATLLLAATSSFGDSLDHDAVKALREAGRILPMEVVMRRALAARPGQLLEAELEREQGRYLYEIRILDPDGQVQVLELDAATGEPIDPRGD